MTFNKMPCVSLQCIKVLYDTAKHNELCISNVLLYCNQKECSIIITIHIIFIIHQGMMNTANALHIKLEGEGILQRIFQAYPVSNPLLL